MQIDQGHHFRIVVEARLPTDADGLVARIEKQLGDKVVQLPERDDPFRRDAYSTGAVIREYLIGLAGGLSVEAIKLAIKAALLATKETRSQALKSGVRIQVQEDGLVEVVVEIDE